MRTYPLLVLGALLAACGGESFTGPADGGTDTGGNGDGASDGASDGGGSPGCPSKIPVVDSACTREGLRCEYGSNPNVSCNPVAQCQNGKWSLTYPPPSGCIIEPNPPACPPTYASVPQGKSCSASFPADCSYPEGQCGCTVPSGPFPVDAAAVAVWICENPKVGCPRPRPRLGEACASAGLVCDYGSCTLPSGVQLECSGGVWVETPAPCPG